MTNRLLDKSRAIFLSIRNDEQEFSYWIQRAEACKMCFPDNAEEKLAEELDRALSECYPQLSSPVFEGLLASAFLEVNWRAVANRLLLLVSHSLGAQV